MKRFFDLAFSILALLVLFPLFLLISVILKFSGEGEIFYSQARVGKEKRPFKILKFATMLKKSPNMGSGTITLKNDPRILPFGKFLRKTKINELPQLINILKGEMSFVGPRPQTQRCFDVFPLKYQKIIIKTKPGLSGIGAIIFRNEENFLIGRRKKSTIFYDRTISPYKAKVESWYVSHQSLLNYFLIIVLSLWIIFFQETKLVWRVFPLLPQPPQKLKRLLFS